MNRSKKKFRVKNENDFMIREENGNKEEKSTETPSGPSKDHLLKSFTSVRG